MRELEEALSHYSFAVKDSTLLRHNENMTYKIDGEERSYVLRIHQPIEGFNLDLLRMGKDAKEQIKDEMKLLEILSQKSDIGTQRPVRNKENDLVTTLTNGVVVTVLEWVEGRTIEEIGLTSKIAFQIGEMVGKLHQVTEGVELSNRYSYNEILLEVMEKECERAYEKEHFTKQQKEIVSGTLEYMRNFFMKNKEKQFLVHADLGMSNLLYQNGKVIPIDFSLSGSSIAAMDLASVFGHINEQSLHADVEQGYRSIREAEIGDQEVFHAGLDVCFCFQILLFVICQHNVVADQPWFRDCMERWCREQFVPLLEKKKVKEDIGLYS